MITNAHMNSLKEYAYGTVLMMAEA